ncbi:hypothetical protein E2C01_018386 [Portunus trituberculatus]|uniref:Uncharacterized protein n=1 Tax=Portunus trituberculatus TaxID=210409 RepID=A0A5B7DUX2_PORTR|nr:hypothetical protein [Portunus trituberculatus]
MLHDSARAAGDDWQLMTPQDDNALMQQQQQQEEEKEKEEEEEEGRGRQWLLECGGLIGEGKGE